MNKLLIAGFFSIGLLQNAWGLAIPGGGLVSTAKIKDEAVTTPKIAPAAVTAPKISVFCSDEEVMKVSGGAWICAAYASSTGGGWTKSASIISPTISTDDIVLAPGNDFEPLGVGNNSVKIGGGAKAPNNQDTAVGVSCDLTGPGSDKTGVGNLCDINGPGGVGVGAQVRVADAFGTAVGFQADAGGVDATAVGAHSSATIRATAVGETARAIGEGSGCFGYECYNQDANTMNFGSIAEPISIIYGGEGFPNTSPLPFAIGTSSAGGSNIAGATFAIFGGQGTGTGAGGALLLQTAPPGSSSDSQNARVTQVTVAATGEVTFAKGPVMSFKTSDPCSGTGFPEGIIFYNSTANVMCYCSAASADLKFSDDSACFP